MLTSVRRRSYMVIAKNNHWILPTAVMSALGDAVLPYLYNIFVAFLLDSIISEVKIGKLISMAVIIAAVNAILTVLCYYLKNLSQEHFDTLGMYEKNSVTDSLMRMDHETFCGQKMRELVDKHRSFTGSYGGILGRYVFFLKDILSYSSSVFVGCVVIGSTWIEIFSFHSESFIQEAGSFTAVLAVVVLSVLGIYKFSAILTNRTNRLDVEYSAQSAVFNTYRDVLSKQGTGKEIRIYGFQNFISEEINQAILINGLKIKRKIIHSQAMSEGIRILVKSVIAFGVYYIVCTRVLSGSISLGKMFVTINSLMAIVEGGTQLSKLTGSLRSLDVKAQIYFDIIALARSAAEYDENNPKDAKHSKAGIVCKDLSYSYEKDKYVLEKVNLVIQPGEHIALVGVNGSGKTTLSRLLTGLLMPKSGYVMINGVKITEENRNSISNYFSVVNQKYTLFDMPLCENVACKSMNSSDYDDLKVHSVLNAVGFPDKYDLSRNFGRNCDPDGIELSGGEQQRLAIARAMYRDTPIMILDEPTAALDPYAEHELYQQYSNMTKGKTVLFISHRLSSCRFCDRIIVMDCGKIVQQGTHDELIKDTSGRYYDLWRNQAKYFD